ncbi:unnamed protein product, partial [Colletotrichum noveboracense]
LEVEGGSGGDPEPRSGPAEEASNGPEPAGGCEAIAGGRWGREKLGEREVATYDGAWFWYWMSARFKECKAYHLNFLGPEPGDDLSTALSPTPEE